MPTKTRVKTKGGGLTVRTHGGLNKKNYAAKNNSNYGKRLQFDDAPVPVQFFGVPGDETYFIEYEMHQWQGGGRWNYVPCLGEGCPLCQDEDSKKSGVRYRFCCLVYNHQEKKVQILEGPKDLAQRIGYRYERAKKGDRFLKIVYEVTKIDGQPVSYDVNRGDDDPLPAKAMAKMTTYDLQEYINDEAKRYFGDELPDATSLDADDDIDEDADDLDDVADDDDDVEDEEDDETSDLREELDELNSAQLKKRAKNNGATAKAVKELSKKDLIDLVIEQEGGASEDEDEDEDEDLDDDDIEDDDDLDDDDDDEDEDEDDDDEPPPAARKRTAPAKKAAKKAPARKATGKRK